MQQFLNEEYIHLRKCSRKRPDLWLLVILLLGLAAVFTWIGIMCGTSWTCPKSMSEAFMIIGISILFGAFLVTTISCLLGIFLNCCYEYTWPPETRAAPKWASASYSEHLRGKINKDRQRRHTLV